MTLRDIDLVGLLTLSHGGKILGEQAGVELLGDGGDATIQPAEESCLMKLK